MFKASDLERLDDLFNSLQIGDEVPVCVVKEDKDGQVHLSISRALAEKDWETAEDLMKSQEMFDAIVETFNRGGVIARLGQVRGFVPASPAQFDFDQWSGSR